MHVHQRFNIETIGRVIIFGLIIIYPQVAQIGRELYDHNKLFINEMSVINIT